MINVNACIYHYYKGDEVWKRNLEVAYSCVYILSVFALKHNSDYSESINEIMEETGYKKLHEITDIAKKLNEWD